MSQETVNSRSICFFLVSSTCRFEFILGSSNQAFTLDDVYGHGCLQLGHVYPAPRSSNILSFMLAFQISDFKGFRVCEISNKARHLPRGPNAGQPRVDEPLVVQPISFGLAPTG